MATGRVRIYQLSKELNLENRETLALCDRLNIAAEYHVSTITEEEANRIRQFLKPSNIQRLTIRRTLRTGHGYIEPLLDVADALPLHMAFIPSGTFTMGSSRKELEHDDSESPQHKVTVLQFFMGRYPVTQAQYRCVMGNNPATRFDKSHFVAPNKPVVGVTWHNAVEFCERLAKQTGRPYRLPSEAEWEYACRAGTITPFYFGRTLTAEVANYDGDNTYADGPKGKKRNGITSVNHFGLANAFGLSDMHGNVLEWCQDFWHDNYQGAPTDGSAWIKGGNSSFRVVRGGSWDLKPRDCRSAYRVSSVPSIDRYFIGFRVCCSISSSHQ